MLSGATLFFRNPLFYDGQEGLPLRIGDDLGVHSSSSLKNAKDRHFAPSTARPFAFAASAKITFVDFDGSQNWRNILQLLRNGLPQMVVKKASGIAMNANKLGGHTSRCYGNKMFEQPIDLKRPELAILYVHRSAYKIAIFCARPIFYHLTLLIFLHALLLD